MKKLTVALLNDSFPPTIDGVANVVLNYARNIQAHYGTAVVATPRYPGVVDNYPFEVIRYPSASLGERVGYRAGYPFDPVAVTQIEKRNVDIIHTHCPFASTILARVLRYYTGAPVVFTYHTKFDYDIERRLALDSLRKASVQLLLANISACDEVWAVSHGAGENLRSLGYTGSYVVMENGTDFPKGRAPQEQLDALSQQYGLNDGLPVFLFVARMVWYKGLRLILDGLAASKARGRQFHALFVGDGIDRQEVEAYAAKLGLDGCSTFTGAIHDRDLLRAFYSRADLFLFPNDYDTSGIVVKEAAACACPSLLLKGSCAAEGVVGGKNGLLTDNSAEHFADQLEIAWKDPQRLHDIGRDASDSVYLSWEDAVARAYDRYQQVMENYARTKPRHLLPAGQMLFKGLHGVQRTARAAGYHVQRAHHTYRLAGRALKRKSLQAGTTVKRKVRDELQKISDDFKEP